MSHYIKQETDILERELRAYEHIRFLLKKKQDCLVDSNPEGIRQVTCEIEETIAKIRNHEKERSKLLDEFIASRLTRPVKDPDTWMKAFPDEGISPDYLSTVFKAHERVKECLKVVLQDVARIQETNRLLIQQGREVLQSCMECLYLDVSTEAYDSRGVTTRKIDPDRRILDQRI